MIVDHETYGNHKRSVKVEVEDNGRGIPQEKMDKLTDVFTTRIDKKPNGGLGLLIVRRIINIHGGDIAFENVANERTRGILISPEWKDYLKWMADENSESSS